MARYKTIDTSPRLIPVNLERQLLPGTFEYALHRLSDGKAALWVAMKEAWITKVQLAKKLGVDEKEIRRLLDPHYGSKLRRIAHAIDALGRRLVIGLETA